MKAEIIIITELFFISITLCFLLSLNIFINIIFSIYIYNPIIWMYQIKNRILKKNKSIQITLDLEI